MTDLLDALVEVVIVEGRPLPMRWFQYTRVIARTSAASTAFLATVGKRDRQFGLWVVLQSEHATTGRMDRVMWSARVLAAVRHWQIDPKAARERARVELAERRTSQEPQPE